MGAGAGWIHRGEGKPTVMAVGLFRASLFRALNRYPEL
jgi:hypothetical protein